MLHPPVSVLFLSRHNAARSQIAEALLRRCGRSYFLASSAGTETGALDPLAQSVLGDLGIDISGQLAKPVENFYGRAFDYVITLCPEALEFLPEFPGTHRHIHWDFPDPSEVTGGVVARRLCMKRIVVQLGEHLREWTSAERRRLAATGSLAAVA